MHLEGGTYLSALASIIPANMSYTTWPTSSAPVSSMPCSLDFCASMRAALSEAGNFLDVGPDVGSCSAFNCTTKMV